MNVYTARAISKGKTHLSLFVISWKPRINADVVGFATADRVSGLSRRERESSYLTLPTGLSTCVISIIVMTILISKKWTRLEVRSRVEHSGFRLLV